MRLIERRGSACAEPREVHTRMSILRPRARPFRYRAGRSQGLRDDKEA